MDTENKLRLAVSHYRREADQIKVEVSSERIKAKRESLTGELHDAAWFRGRYDLLLELYRAKASPPETLHRYANLVPGGRAREPVPLLPASSLPSSPPSPTEVRAVIFLTRACVVLAITAVLGLFLKGVL